MPDNDINIPGLTPDDKVPGQYNNIVYGAARKSTGSSTTKCRLVGNMAPSVAASISAITRSIGTVGPLITASGTPTAVSLFIVEITTGGTATTAVFRWSSNNGNSFTSGVTATGSAQVLANGVSVTFIAGTYVLGEMYSFSAAPAGFPGTATLNVFYPIASEEEAASRFVRGSELFEMCRAALDVDGVSLWAMANEGAVGASSATLTFTITGAWAASGECGFRVKGTTYVVGVSDDDTQNALAVRLATTVNNDANALFTAVASTNTVVLTFKTPGIRGNTLSGWPLTGLAPAGLSLTATGGTPLIGGGVPFAGGAGTDNLTAALAAALTENVDLYDFYGYAQQDAVNASLVEAQLDVKASPLVANYEQATFAVNGTQAAAIALSQVTLNAVFCGLLLDEQGESYPPAMAAQFAALRSVTEGANPNPDYDNAILPSMAVRAATAKAAEPTHAKLKAQLNAGITPVVTLNGKKVIVRGITTKCLDGAVADYRTLDLGEATVPMRAAREVRDEWEIFKTANPNAGPDPDEANGERAAVAGMGTPSKWRAKLVVLLERMATRRWVYQTAANPPTAYWDDISERIMSSTPVKVLPINHQNGNELRQL